jgi:glucose/arabinose dehydrogenase
VSVENFLTGFAFDPAHDRSEADRHRGRSYSFARLAGIAVAKDGAVLIADDANGIIYRVASRRRHQVN